jgi:hypothetical protein
MSQYVHTSALSDRALIVAHASVAAVAAAALLVVGPLSQTCLPLASAACLCCLWDVCYFAALRCQHACCLLLYHLTM